MSLDPANRLSLALSCARMATWDWEAPNGVMVWDERMHEFFGLEPGGFNGRYEQFLSFIHPEDRDGIAAEIQEAFDQRTEFDGEFRVIRQSDASVHFLRMRFTVPESSQNDLTQLAGVCWDVTERRHTEQQLAAKVTLLDTLMESLPDHIYFKDRESRFIAVNKAKAVSNKLDPGEMVGMTDFDFYTDEHAREAYEDEQRLIETGKSIVGVEEKETWPDGSVTFVSTTKLPLRDEKGRIIGTFGLSRDITEHKRLENKVQEQNQALEQDLEMARELQAALLPQEYPCFPRDVSGPESAIRFHHIYRPSTVVSGDFFDILEVNDNQAGMFICDVMGHGVRAALVAAIVRTLVSELRPVWSEPAEFLTQLNLALRGALRGTQIPLFASAFYVVADLARSQFRFANAGHPFPLHITEREEGRQPQTSTLSGGKPGPALGLLDEAHYELHERPLAPRDVVLLFTDGLFEVESSEGELYDYAHLSAAVAKHGALAPADLCREVVEEVERISAGSEFDDDVCLVAMEIARLS